MRKELLGRIPLIPDRIKLIRPEIPLRDLLKLLFPEEIAVYPVQHGIILIPENRS